MLVISSREFRDSQKKYFELAKVERVIVKRNKEFIELIPRGNTIPENPSPSNDPYFDDPGNLVELRRRIIASKQGADNPTILTKEQQKELLGL
jgi:antitoxin YefM